jgi:hypothetical protein
MGGFVMRDVSDCRYANLALRVRRGRIRAAFAARHRAISRGGLQRLGFCRLAPFRRGFA